jgi:4-amino-4-deoxy-L-arabinose transferase-like glycosyltransferase
MLYHLSVAPLSALLAPFDLVTQVYVLRMVSVLLAVLTVAAAWFTIRTIFPNRKLFALGAVTFIVFWPMHSHVTASINADGLAELIAALFFLILAKAWRDGFSYIKWLLLFGILVTGILTKPTMFFLIPTLISVLVIYGGRKLRWNNKIIGGLVGSLFVVVWVGAVFLYENSNGGRKLLSIFSEGINLPDWAGYFTPATLMFYVRSLNFAVLSFAGLFGWSNIHIPWSWVRVWALVLGIVLVGILLFVTQNLLGIGSRQENLNQYQKEILAIFLAAIGFSLMGVTMPVVITQSPSWGIHSRYYFPVIVPIALYLFLGTYQLMPKRLGKVLWPGWLLFWFGYDLVILIYVLTPYLFS